MDYESLEKLIRMVKERPFLWNVNNRYYLDRSAKLKAWQEISKELNQPYELCKTSWRNLRDRFIRLLAKPAKNGSEPKWVYFNLLTFLRDDVNNSMTWSNVKPEPNDSLDEASTSVMDHEFGTLCPANNSLQDQDARAIRTFLLKHYASSSPQPNEDDDETTSQDQVLIVTDHRHDNLPNGDYERGGGGGGPLAKKSRKLAYNHYHGNGENVQDFMNVSKMVNDFLTKTEPPTGSSSSDQTPYDVQQKVPSDWIYYMSQSWADKLRTVDQTYSKKVARKLARDVTELIDRFVDSCQQDSI